MKSNNNLNDLASCPFCGSEVVIRRNTAHFSVSCTNEKCFLRKIWYESEQDVIDIWNLRAADDGSTYKILKLLDRAEQEAKNAYQSLWHSGMHAQDWSDEAKKSHFYMMFYGVLDTARVLRKQIEMLKETA